MSDYRAEAWTDGEQAVFAALCAATNAEQGKTAFLGSLPPQLGAWALNVSGGNLSTTFKDMAPTEIKFDGILEGHFDSRRRDLAQRTAMQWLQALPIRQDPGVVYVARATAPPQCDWGYIPVLDDQGKEKYKVGAWLIRLDIECVFRTRY